MPGVRQGTLSGQVMTTKLLAKICSVAVLVLLVIAALGPAKWAPRSGLLSLTHVRALFDTTRTIASHSPGIA